MIKGACLTVGLLLAARLPAAPAAPDAVRSEAREIFAHIVGIESSVGKGQVPAVAEYLAQRFGPAVLRRPMCTCCRSGRRRRWWSAIAAAAGGNGNGTAVGRSRSSRTWTSSPRIAPTGSETPTA